MYKLSGFFLLILVIVTNAGCHARYSAQEYAALKTEMETIKNQFDTCISEKDRLTKDLDDARKNIEKASSQITREFSGKQDLLDKNLDCMEENKNLLKQISRLKTLNQEKKEAQGRLHRAFDYLSGYLETERMNDQIYIMKAEEVVKIILPQKTLYPTPFSAHITLKGESVLKKIAKGLIELKPLSIGIDGHTDFTAIPKQYLKTYPTQWDLSHARAVSVLFIIEGLGIKKDRLSASSYGDARPLADPATEEGKTMNRRVEIVITP